MGHHPPAALPRRALVLAVAGVLLPPLLPVALVLGLVALARGGRPGYAERRGLTLGALLVALGAVALWAMGAAVAVPAFARYRLRARQAECPARLTAALAAERAYFALAGRYALHPAELDWSPPADARSLLRFAEIGPLAPAGSPPGPEAVGFLPLPARVGGPVETLDERVPDEVRSQLGVHGACPDCAITLACAADLDDDATLDLWSIASGPRRRPDGPAVPAGEPFHHVDDLTEAVAPLPPFGLPQAAVRPAPAPPPLADEDPRAWMTWSFDGRTGLKQTSVGERCLLTCTLADGARAWEAVGPCQSTRGERRFLAADCGRLVVLVPAPVRGKAWTATEVMRVYQREELAYAVMGAAVLPEKVMRASITWLQGCFGAPGPEPRYSSDGQWVEYTTVDGAAGRVSLRAEQRPVPAAAPRKPRPRDPRR